MRKSRTARFLALFMGVWLSLVQSDAGLFHACATGNGAVAAFEQAEVSSAPGDDHTHHATGHGTGHDVHVGAVAVTADDAPDSSHHHPSGDGECHCIGHCCVATPPALRAPDTYALVVLVRRTTVQPGRAAQAVVAEWADYVLPFSTAPPVVIAG
jgi:hypothetical protein